MRRFLLGTKRWFKERLYFVKRGQATKHQFYKRSKKVAHFYIWQMLWEAGYPPTPTPTPTYLASSWRCNCHLFAYHRGSLVEQFATQNSVQLKVAVSSFLQNRGDISYTNFILRNYTVCANFGQVRGTWTDQAAVAGHPHWSVTWLSLATPSKHEDIWMRFIPLHIKQISGHFYLPRNTTIYFTQQFSTMLHVQVCTTIFKHVHLCLKMIVQTETCSSVEHCCIKQFPLRVNINCY
jgi:hypothetical protein